MQMLLRSFLDLVQFPVKKPVPFIIQQSFYDLGGNLWLLCASYKEAYEVEKCAKCRLL